MVISLVTLQVICLRRLIKKAEAIVDGIAGIIPLTKITHPGGQRPGRDPPPIQLLSLEQPLSRLTVGIRVKDIVPTVLVDIKLTQEITSLCRYSFPPPRLSDGKGFLEITDSLIVPVVIGFEIGI